MVSEHSGWISPANTPVSVIFTALCFMLKPQIRALKLYKSIGYQEIQALNDRIKMIKQIGTIPAILEAAGSAEFRAAAGSSFRLSGGQNNDSFTPVTDCQANLFSAKEHKRRDSGHKNRQEQIFLRPI